MKTFPVIALHLIALIDATNVTNVTENVNLFDNWIVESATLPTLPAVIGYAQDTNTLYLLGGINQYNCKQLASYDISSKTVTDSGYVLTIDGLYAGSQYYAQIGSLIYMSDSGKGSINTFDVSTQEIKTNVLSYTTEITQRSCFVNIADRYLGIYSPSKSVYLYDTDSNSWLTPDYSPTSTSLARYDSSCVYINDYLYIVGGVSSFGFAYDDMEYIHITAVINGETEETWASKVLGLSIFKTRLVAVEDKGVILMLGGTDGDNVFNSVYSIDTVSKEIATVGTMAKKVYSQSVYMIDDVIFSFGGYKGGYLSDPWEGLQSNALYPVFETIRHNEVSDYHSGGSNMMTIYIAIVCVVIVVGIVVAVVFYRRSKKKEEEEDDDAVALVQEEE